MRASSIETRALAGVILLRARILERGVSPISLVIMPSATRRSQVLSNFNRFT